MGRWYFDEVTDAARATFFMNAIGVQATGECAGP